MSLGSFLNYLPALDSSVYASKKQKDMLNKKTEG